MASSTVGKPGFVHGTWALDGHERPGLRCILFDVAGVGAESRAQ